MDTRVRVCVQTDAKERTRPAAEVIIERGAEVERLNPKTQNRKSRIIQTDAHAFRWLQKRIDGRKVFQLTQRGEDGPDESV